MEIEIGDKVKMIKNIVPPNVKDMWPLPDGPFKVLDLKGTIFEDEIEIHLGIKNHGWWPIEWFEKVSNIEFKRRTINVKLP